MGTLLDIARNVQLPKRQTAPLSPVVHNKTTTEKSASATNKPGATGDTIWVNPHKQGTPEARQASLELIVEAMLHGLAPLDTDQTEQVNDKVRDVISGKAKLADFRHLLGLLH